MDYLTKDFFSRCKAEFSKYGFKRKSKVFVRVINDVVQTLSIEALRSYSECRVGFAIIPLCLRIEKNYILMGSYSRYLRRFEGTYGTSPSDSWKYDSKSEKSCEVCVDEIMRFLKQYLIPLYERANCCDTALSEIFAVDKLFSYNGNREPNLNSQKMEGFAEHVALINYLDSPMYYMALKNNDYSLALKCRQAMLSQNLDSYNSFLANKPIFDGLVESGKLTEEDRKRWRESLVQREESIEVLKEEVSHLEAKDVEYFQRLIKENEAYSKKVLESII